MSQANEQRLELIVEQVVRPLWASRARKRFMREELLAHALAIFDEELAVQVDESAAFETTCNRFGLVHELERDLQDSVPWLERMFLKSERDILMSRWYWIAAAIAVAVGPGLILPALAKFKEHGVLQWMPLTLGVLITLVGLAGIGYGMVRLLVKSA